MQQDMAAPRDPAAPDDGVRPQPLSSRLLQQHSTAWHLLPSIQQLHQMVQRGRCSLAEVLHGALDSCSVPCCCWRAPPHGVRFSTMHAFVCVYKHPGPTQAAPQAPRAWDLMPTASWDVPFMTIDCAVLAELWGDCGYELPKVGRGSPADAALGIWQKTFDIAR